MWNLREDVSVSDQGDTYGIREVMPDYPWVSIRGYHADLFGTVMYIA